MSLRETIEGACDEAKETVESMTKKAVDGEKSSDDEKTVAAYDPFKTGKATAAGAKPAREAAASVRMEGSRPKKNPVTMTKEEKKAARAEERALEDKRNQAYDYILKGDPAFKKTEKMWWVLLGLGFGFTVISLLVTYVFPNESKEYTTAQGIAGIVTLVLAYAFIIAAFVYDFRKRRPFRKAAERRLQGMNDKKVADYLKAENTKAAKLAAEKEADKAAKKAAKGK